MSTVHFGQLLTNPCWQFWFRTFNCQGTEAFFRVVRARTKLKWKRPLSPGWCGPIMTWWSIYRKEAVENVQAMDLWETKLLGWHFCSKCSDCWIAKMVFSDKSFFSITGMNWYSWNQRIPFSTSLFTNYVNSLSTRKLFEYVENQEAR